MVVEKILGNYKNSSYDIVDKILGKNAKKKKEHEHEECECNEKN